MSAERLRSRYNKMRKTKIICTIGPACESEETIREMCLAGMNVARLNFSHGSHEEHLKRIQTIKKVRGELGLPIAIMLDTKGPEYRIKKFRDRKVTLNDGDTFIFTTDDCEGTRERVSVSDKDLTNEVRVGDTILVNDGLLEFKVRDIKGSDIVCDVVTGGEISDRKSMNFPGRVFNKTYLSEQDKSDLLFGIENDIDLIAASFVSNKSDIASLRDFINANNGENIDVIAKIENRSGVDNIDGICEIADGVMVARGDLGVEIPFVEVPSTQKYIIKKCRLLGKRVITATEMLESMIEKPRPTRAEISDVANAVYDGTSAVMLSGETAAGRHPVEAVRAMAEIALATEQNINYAGRFAKTTFRIQNNIDAVSHSTCSMAIDTMAKGIVISSLSGTTVRMVSRFRPPVDIIGMTTSEKEWRKLNLSWGVTPVLSEEFNSVDVMFYHALKSAKSVFDLKKGDNVVLTGGSTSGISGNTNTIRLEEIK